MPRVCWRPIGVECKMRMWWWVVRRYGRDWARSAALRNRRQVKQEILAVASLIRNQERVISDRMKYMSRDSARARAKQEDIAKKQAQLYGALTGRSASPGPRTPVQVVS